MENYEYEFIDSKKKYFMGDCRLSILSQVLKRYNIDVYQSDILGYGMGLNFEVQNFNITPKIQLFNVWGRKINCEKKFCQEAGIEFCEKVSKNQKNLVFDLEIIDAVSKGKPVIIAVDRFFLNFLKIKKAHYGYHVILIISINLEDNTMDVYDVMAEKIETVDIDIIKQAMYIDLPVASPNGVWYTINNISEIREKQVNDFKRTIYDQSELALGKRGMLNEMLETVKFLKVCEKKARIYKSYKTYIDFQIPYLLSIFKEQEGSGSFYREVYYEFLERNCIKFQLYELLERVKQDFLFDINLWKQLCSEIKSIEDDNCKKTIILCNYLSQIYLYEQKIFLTIKNCVEKIL